MSQNDERSWSREFDHVATKERARTHKNNRERKDKPKTNKEK